MPCSTACARGSSSRRSPTSPRSTRRSPTSSPCCRFSRSARPSPSPSADEDPRGRVSLTQFEGEALATNILFGLAEQFGEATTGVRGSALRRSRQLPVGDAWRSDPAFEEPHRRGEVLVAAVIDALVGMWMRRLRALEHQGAVDRERAAEEGAKAAAHLLTMVIRSLDYAPAIELAFEDVLDAVIVADEVIAPDDQHDYRGALRDSFARYDIHQPAGRMVDLAQMAMPFRYDQINATALRSSKQEAYRFIWQNLAALDAEAGLAPAGRVAPPGAPGRARRPRRAGGDLRLRPGARAHRRPGARARRGADGAREPADDPRRGRAGDGCSCSSGVAGP